MAIVNEIDPAAWKDWVESRPVEVQELCKKLPPDRLYRMKDSGHRVTIYSYSEDGTVTVNVTGEYNTLTFDRQVFGVSPDDLQECDLPEEEEQLGTMLTEDEEINDFIDEVRPAILAARKKAD